jgi:hypothetical protein
VQLAAAELLVVYVTSTFSLLATSWQLAFTGYDADGGDCTLPVLRKTLLCRANFISALCTHPHYVGDQLHADDLLVQVAAARLLRVCRTVIIAMASVSDASIGVASIAQCNGATARSDSKSFGERHPHAHSGQPHLLIMYNYPFNLCQRL